MALNVTTKIVLDTRTQKKNGLFPVKIRVIFGRDSKYYPTGKDMSPEDFETVMFSQKPRKDQKELRDEILDFEAKAKTIIKDLPFFDWQSFENKYRQRRNLTGGIEHYFAEVVTELKVNHDYNTAETFSGAIGSLLRFKPNLKPHDITVKFLQEYERWMVEVEDEKRGKRKCSVTTVGIYLRNLRAIINKYNLIPSEIYPFGKGRYEIPTARNVKKALTLADIGRIYNHQSSKESINQARDYWLFMYFGNGMNVKDMCYLKYSDIQGNFIYFHRQKTAKTKAVKEQISVPYIQELRDIVKRHGVKTINKNAYIFPFINDDMQPKQVREKVKSMSKWINKRMEVIKNELGIEKDIKTYTARHSFASVLKKAGVPTEAIQDFFKHGSVKITQRYLDSIEDDTMHEIANKLSDFKKLA